MCDGKKVYIMHRVKQSGPPLTAVHTSRQDDAPLLLLPPPTLSAHFPPTFPERIWRHARLFAQLNSRVFSILFCTILKPQKIRPWPAAINSTRVPRWSAKMFDTPIINNAVISFVRLQLRFINEKECRPLVSINQKSSVDDLFLKQEEEVENWTF